MKTNICQPLGITMKTEFVPWSQSRNKKDNPRVSDYSLNWKVTILYNDREILTTDYMAGIGHCKTKLVNKSMRYCVNDADAIIKECETGRYYTNLGWIANIPTLDDVMYCLVLDAGVLDYSCFEDWANDYGYDTDSRSAEKVYRECLAIGLKLKNGIGDKTLAALQEAFQDY